MACLSECFRNSFKECDFGTLPPHTPLSPVIDLAGHVTPLIPPDNVLLRLIHSSGARGKSRRVRKDGVKLAGDSILHADDDMYSSDPWVFVVDFADFHPPILRLLCRWNPETSIGNVVNLTLGAFLPSATKGNRDTSGWNGC